MGAINVSAILLYMHCNDYPIGPHYTPASVRQHAIALATTLDNFNNGFSSVMYCKCGNKTRGNHTEDDDGECTAERGLLGALNATIGYEYASTDFFYVHDPRTGVPTDTLLPEVKYGLIGGAIVLGTVLVVVVLVVSARRYRRWVYDQGHVYDESMEGIEMGRLGPKEVRDLEKRPLVGNPLAPPGEVLLLQPAAAAAVVVGSALPQNYNDVGPYTDVMPRSQSPPSPPRDTTTSISSSSGRT